MALSPKNGNSKSFAENHVVEDSIDNQVNPMYEIEMRNSVKLASSVPREGDHHDSHRESLTL